MMTLVFGARARIGMDVMERASKLSDLSLDLE